MTDVNTIVDGLLERLEQLEEENEEMNVLIHAANEQLKKIKQMSIWEFIKWRKK